MYQDIPDGVEFIAEELIPEALDKHFKDKASSFILRQGLYSDPVARSAGIIFSFGQSPDAPNIKKAIQVLRKAGLLDFRAEISRQELQQELRNFPRLAKIAQRLLNFYELINKYEAPFEELSLYYLEDLIQALVRLKGIGPGTIDPLLLHVFNQPIVPASPGLYRIGQRHGLIAENTGRLELSSVFISIFDYAPEDVAQKIAQKFSSSEISFENPSDTSYEALKAMSLALYYENLQKTAQRYCKTKSPGCASCPLGAMLSYAP